MTSTRTSSSFACPRIRFWSSEPIRSGPTAESRSRSASGFSRGVLCGEGSASANAAAKPTTAKVPARERRIGLLTGHSGGRALFEEALDLGGQDEIVLVEAADLVGPEDQLD